MKTDIRAALVIIIAALAIIGSAMFFHHRSVVAQATDIYNAYQAHDSIAFVNSYEYCDDEVINYYKQMVADSVAIYSEIKAERNRAIAAWEHDNCK